MSFNLSPRFSCKEPGPFDLKTGQMELKGFEPLNARIKNECLTWFGDSSSSLFLNKKIKRTY